MCRPARETSLYQNPEYLKVARSPKLTLASIDAADPNKPTVAAGALRPGCSTGRDPGIPGHRDPRSASNSLPHYPVHRRWTRR